MSGAPTSSERGRPVRSAFRHLVADALARTREADLSTARRAATVELCRILVALAAADSGRIDPDGGVETLLDRVASARPGGPFEADPARFDPGTRRRVAAILSGGPVDGGGSPRPVVAPGEAYEQLLTVELRVVDDADPADPDAVADPADWPGDGAVVLADGDRDGGRHYTPRPVVEGTLRRALAPRIERIRSDASGDVPGRLLDLRVLDPAAGTGRFLVAAVDVLTDALVDARPGDGGTDLPADPDGVRRVVARQCVYGVDADPLAVELARTALWLQAGADATDALRVGDALLGTGPGDPPGPTPDDSLPPGDAGRTDPDRSPVARPLDWPDAFPSVFERGGFDAVVGNPPYVRGRDLPEPVRAHLRERYRTATGAFDLYVPFFERAAALGDRVALVVPNKWTTAEYGRRLRTELVERWGLEAVTDLSSLSVFDADVYPVVVGYAPGGGPRGVPDPDPDRDPVVRSVDSPAGIGPGSGRRDDATDRRADAAPRGRSGDGGSDPGGGVAVPREFLDRVGGRVIPLGVEAGPVDCFERLLATCDRLGEFVEMAEAIHTGNVRDRLVVDDPVDDRCRPLADGSSIERYRVVHSGEWIRYDPSLVGDGEYADLRSPALFEGEKLLVRDVSARPVAAFDDSGLYALNTLYSVRPTGDLPAKYLLGAFNSAVIERYFRAVYGGTHVRNGYLRFKPTYVRRLPVPAPDPGLLSADVRDRVAAHPATDPDDPGAIDSREAVTAAVGSLTDAIADARDRRSGVSTALSSHLRYVPGRRLADLRGFRRLPGAADTPLGATAGDRDGLRIGSASVAGREGELLVRATARYKPTAGAGGDDDGRSDCSDRSRGGDPDTDRWGYVETDPIPAVAVAADAGPPAGLVRRFVPAAVDRAGGFADFRARATKTISPLDRLAALRLPDPAAAREALAAHRDACHRAAALDRRVDRADGLLDGVFADLYGLSPDERRAMGIDGRE